MPLEGHPPDCECCVQVTFGNGRGNKRTREDADLTTFLPDDEPEEAEGEGEGEEEEEEVPDEEEEANLIHSTLFASFDKHVSNLDAARVKRVEILSFKSALEDDGGDEINPDATQDELDGLGVWLPGDERQGDVNFRTLLKLLARVDARGFERCAHANPLRFSHDLRTASLRSSGVSLALAALHASLRAFFCSSVREASISAYFFWYSGSAHFFFSATPMDAVLPEALRLTQPFFNPLDMFCFLTGSLCCSSARSRQPSDHPGCLALAWFKARDFSRYSVVLWLALVAAWCRARTPGSTMVLVLPPGPQLYPPCHVFLMAIHLISASLSKDSGTSDSSTSMVKALGPYFFKAFAMPRHPEFAVT
tara:strand:- start:1987 stop:3078 length:1092 start_codon:yes stop_codon:yes gene_type:complete